MKITGGNKFEQNIEFGGKWNPKFGIYQKNLLKMSNFKLSIMVVFLKKIF